MKIIPSSQIEKPVDQDFLLTPLWGKVIYPASLTVLTASPKAGKSSVLFSWAGCVSNGDSWGGIAPARPLKVLYCDLENPDVIQHLKLSPYKNSNLWVIYQGWMEEQAFDFHQLETAMQAANFWPDVVIIDPLVYAFSLIDENKASDMARAMRRCLRFVRSTKIAVVLAHHDRKPPDGDFDSPRHSARGSSALPGAVDVQMNIILGRAVPGRVQRRRLQVTFSRYGSTEDHEPSFFIEYDNDTHVTLARRTFE